MTRYCTVHKCSIFYAVTVSFLLSLHLLIQDSSKISWESKLKPDRNRDNIVPEIVQTVQTSLEHKQDASAVIVLISSPSKPDRYSWINFPVNNPHLCTVPDGARYLIYILSAPDRFRRREVVRSTWGQNQFLAFHGFRRVFVIGEKSLSNRLRQLLREENGLYHDIVLANIQDSYWNLTLKGIAALKWTSTYCNDVKFVFKTDDDVFINIPRLEKILTAYEDRPRLLLGNVYPHGTTIIRKSSGSEYKKWWISDDMFRGMTEYPRYSSGLLYGFTGDIVRELYLAASALRLFKFEDVYMTGFLAATLADISLVSFQPNFRWQSIASETFWRSLNDTNQPYRHVAALCGSTSACRRAWRVFHVRLMEENRQSFYGVLDNLYEYKNHTLSPEWIRMI